MSAAPAPKAISLDELVGRFGGQLRGDGKRAITGVATLTGAGPGQLTFLANPRYRSVLGDCAAAAILIGEADAEAAVASGATLWITSNAYLLFARVAQFFADAASLPHVPGVDPSAVVTGALIDPSARIGAGCVIGAGAVIGARATIGPACVIGAGAVVGADSLLHARVTIYQGCEIGARAIVHSGVVIGADGFGFARDGATWVKIPQTGRVLIGSDVEIGANTTIDRGALEDTVIGDGVKFDNQIQIGHNVRIGDHTLICGCVGVAGSTTIGARCMIGGAAMIIGHLNIADDVNISVATVVSHSIHKPGLYTGFYPMAENAAWERSAASVRHLDRLRERVRALEGRSSQGEEEK